MRGFYLCLYLTCIEPKYLILHSQCSNSCGYGQKSRDIWCVDLSKSKVNNERCSPSSKPENVSSCFESKCPPKWKHGDWSAVSGINSWVFSWLVRLLGDLLYGRRYPRTPYTVTPSAVPISNPLLLTPVSALGIPISFVRMHLLVLLHVSID